MDYDCAVDRPGEWCVLFPGNNIVSGDASCVSDDDKTCSCRITSHGVSGFVNLKSYKSSSSCEQLCAFRCADAVRYDPDFRRLIFESVAK